jgi:predicted dehydrogenase
MVVDPGHFHAALLQKEMIPGVANTTYIYAPLGRDLYLHLCRIEAFNNRADHPTSWVVQIYAGPDYLHRMVSERPGNIVILSGRNRHKCEIIKQALNAGLHVLADKPWIIKRKDLADIEAALLTARRSRLLADDVMTQRYEITAIVQRELVRDSEVFGKPVIGTQDSAAIMMESVHYLLKSAAGLPNLRPPWFFDVEEQGAGLADVGTHLVDCVLWTLFSDEAIDYQKDVCLLKTTSWPTALSLADFQRITGEQAYPEFLDTAVRGEQLEYMCNGCIDYTIKGIHVHTVVKWAAGAGQGDTGLSLFQGSQSCVEIRRGAEETFRPEVYVTPAHHGSEMRLRRALQRRLGILGNRYPGLLLKDAGNRFQVVIPECFRLDHDAHFELVARGFLKGIADCSLRPEWEDQALLAKYFITTSIDAGKTATEGPSRKLPGR